MVFPEALRPGDTIGLVCPSSPVSHERADSCKHLLESLGYLVVMGKSTYEEVHGYLAGSDELRAFDLNSMFANPCIKAIFCIRGGYGGNRIMHLLDYDLIRQNPKIFVGYSDITSFHLAFHSLCHFVTFHGPMVSSNMIDDFDSYTKESLHTALNLQQSMSFVNPSDEPITVLSEGYASGELIGGCLSLVSPSIGTFYQPDFKGKILFLEDVHESLPRCDKMIEHLFSSGIMNDINGLILGDFQECINEEDPSYSILDYFKDRLSNFKKPVLCNIRSGHCTPMGTLPFGCRCTIDTSNKSITLSRP